MKNHFDKLETRDAEKRERALFSALRALLQHAVRKAPGLKRQLRGVDIDSLRSREALARVPVLRKGELAIAQAKRQPFAGLATSAPGTLKRLMVSPGPILEPQGYGRDWWGSARALHAAGFRKGDIVHNSFSYHLTPGGHIMESGAHALKCAVIPAGVGNTEQQVEAITLYRPDAYTGTPDFLKILLDAADAAARPAASIKKAVVSGAAFPPSLQEEVRSRGIDAYQAYATADLGVIAYETSARSGLVCNEDMIIEIVGPGTDDPLPMGEIGEVVVTRLNPDYPLLRFATGDLSRFQEGESACGRTNLRLAGWLGRADQSAKVKGMFVRPAQIVELAKRHPELGRVRLVISRTKAQDKMTLRAEAEAASPELSAALAATLQSLTKLKGAVEIVALASLPVDGKVIDDTR